MVLFFFTIFAISFHNNILKYISVLYNYNKTITSVLNFFYKTG